MSLPGLGQVVVGHQHHQLANPVAQAEHPGLALPFGGEELLADQDGVGLLELAELVPREKLAGQPAEAADEPLVGAVGVAEDDAPLLDELAQLGQVGLTER